MSKLVRSSYVIPVDDSYSGWGYALEDPFSFGSKLPDFAIWLLAMFAKAELKPINHSTVQLVTTKESSYLHINAEGSLYQEFQANPIYFEQPR